MNRAVGIGNRASDRAQRTLPDANHTDSFAGLPPKSKETKAKLNKWDLINLKNFHTAKKTINKTQRKPTESENIFTNDMTNKGLMPQMYKQLI